MIQRGFVIALMVAAVGVFLVMANFAWQGWLTQPTPQASVNHPRRNTNDPVLVGAGDISICNNDHDEETAKLLDGIEGTVFTLGDNVYPGGRPKEFTECYHPTWGRHRERTYPVVGNHEYVTDKAAGYFEYFGDRAGSNERGYYRYTLGAWEIFVLNSNCGEIGGCDESSPQYQWLQQELVDYPSGCAVAMLHHPPFSSALHGNAKSVAPLWQVLADAGVDVVLAGHDHVYERFAPLDRDGHVSLTGTRAFVVGTGGRSLYSFRNVAEGSEVRLNKDYGVLKLTLHPDAYSWQFISVERGELDRGNTACH